MRSRQHGGLHHVSMRVAKLIQLTSAGRQSKQTINVVTYNCGRAWCICIHENINGWCVTRTTSRQIFVT